MRNSDVFFDVCLNKQSICWRLQKLWCSCDVPVMYAHVWTYGRDASSPHYLTHWGRVTHICVSKLTIIGSDNDLSPGRRQAIIWTNAGILLMRTLGTNLSEILREIHTFSFKKMRLKLSSAKWRPFYLVLNVLIRTMRLAADMILKA